jgi:hypothetical protein
MKRTWLFLVVLAVLVASPCMQAQWKTAGLDSVHVNALFANGTLLFAGTNGAGVYCSSDNGSSWFSVNSGLPTQYISCFGASGTRIFCGTHLNDLQNSGLFCSTDNGNLWNGTEVDSVGIEKILSSGTHIYALVSGGPFTGTALLHSSDCGVAWNRCQTPAEVSEIVVNDAFIFAFGDPILGPGDFRAAGAYRSTDEGESWTLSNAGLVPMGLWPAFLHGTTLFVQSEGSTASCFLFRSTNNGADWNAVPPISIWLTSFASHGCNLFIGDQILGVRLSTDDGTSWTGVSQGLPSGSISALAVNDSYVFAAAEHGVWRRRLSEIVTSIDELFAETPQTIRLDQNYPNPFNPLTTIRYGLPHKSHVTLTVFNTLGQQVATLVEGEQEAGYHEVKFDASGLSSGVYFYRLTAGSYVETKKLLLVR